MDPKGNYRLFLSLRRSGVMTDEQWEFIRKYFSEEVIAAMLLEGKDFEQIHFEAALMKHLEEGEK